MKKKKLFLFGLLAISIAGVTLYSNFTKLEDLKYSPKKIENLDHESGGAAEIYKSMHTNHETGEVMTSEDFIRDKEQFKLMRQDRSNLISWGEEGPANIGGRTRAICIDRNDKNHLFAGSVTGGLYESKNGANVWSKVDKYPGNLAISSIQQTLDGKFYVGTGMAFTENRNGDGIWVLSNGNWSQLTGTSGFSKINELATNDVDNTLWIAADGNGLYKYKEGTLSKVTGTNGLPNLAVIEVEVSFDGQLIVVGIIDGLNVRTYVSENGGDSFTDYSESDNTSNPIPSSSKRRVEYSIAKQKVEGNYYVYASLANSLGHYGGAFVSQNSGKQWSQLAPNVSNINEVDLFNPVASGTNPQGIYNLVTKVTPWDPTGFFLGGIDLYRWKRQVNNPPYGNFKQVSQWSANPTSSVYVHADNHEIVFDKDNKMYIGNDGGIGVNNNPKENFSTGIGLQFYSANRNYNVTQFYAIAYSGLGDVLGGTQDNGSLLNTHKNSTYQDFTEVLGGDGFECAISVFNPNVMFASSQYGRMARSSDRGEEWKTNFFKFPDTYRVGQGGGRLPFHSILTLGEYYDEKSKDSLNYTVRGTYNIGQKIKVPSLSTGDTILYTLTQNTLYEDTVFYDPSLSKPVYVVKDEKTGQNFDLSVFNHSIAEFPSTTSLEPPTVGDSIYLIRTTIPDSAHLNDTIVVKSFTSYQVHYGKNPVDGRQLPMGIDTFKTNVAWDTLRVQDPFQSWLFTYATSSGGEIWGTREALRFSKKEVERVRIARDVGSVSRIEVSHDLSRVYICTSSGLKVITGLDTIYSQDKDFKTLASELETDNGVTVSDISGISNAGSVAFDPDNPDHIIVGPTGFGTIKESFNATSTTPSFTTVSGLNTSIYDVEFIKDVSVPNGSTYISAGTDEGFWIRNNNQWEDCSQGFGKVPVERIEYAWRTYDQGNLYYGAVYIGTFGRGIWKSTSFLSTPDEPDYPKFDNQKVGLQVFPNPVSDQGFITFNLQDESEVYFEIYSITGKLIKRNPKRILKKGENKISFDINNLNSGAYFVRLRVGDKIEISKFIKD